MNASRSRDERSAQCRSSSVTSSGLSAPANSPSRSRTNSQRRPWAEERGSLAARASSLRRGNRAVISARASSGKPCSASAVQAPGRSRSAAMTGAYANCSPPNSTASPCRITKPASDARASSAPIRRVLPIPASPERKAIPGRPSAAAASEASRALRTSSRPMIARLEILAANVAHYGHAQEKRPPRGERDGLECSGPGLLGRRSELTWGLESGWIPSVKSEFLGVGE